MKKKIPSQKTSENIPVSKQTAGGVAGAIVGGVVGGPVGAVAGAIAGTIMGNRAAQGKLPVSSAAVKKTTEAVRAIRKKLPSTAKKSAAKMGPRSSKSAKVTRHKTPGRRNEKKVVGR